MKHYLVLDLSAKSGRAILETFQEEKLTFSKEYRF